MRINASHPPELIQLGDLAQGSEAPAKKRRESAGSPWFKANSAGKVKKRLGISLDFGNCSSLGSPNWLKPYFLSTSPNLVWVETLIDIRFLLVNSWM